jgi:hypothetical protein
MTRANAAPFKVVDGQTGNAAAARPIKSPISEDSTSSDSRDACIIVPFPRRRRPPFNWRWCFYVLGTQMLIMGVIEMARIDSPFLFLFVALLCFAYARC